MFKLVVIIPLQPGKGAAFEELTKPLVEKSQKEKGCISYELLPDKLQPNCYLFLETWESDEALAAHEKTQHFVDFAAKLSNYTTGPMTIHRVEP